MSTTLAKPAEMADRKWYVIDAAGKPLGRVAPRLLSSCAVRTRPPLLLTLTVVTMSSSSTATRLS